MEEELPLIEMPVQPVWEPPAPDPHVHVAVYHKGTGLIRQVVHCQTSMADKQHALWDGHHYMVVDASVSPRSHAVDIVTGNIMDKDRTEELAAEKVRGARSATTDTITNGFTSVALGKTHEYPANPTDQGNMLMTAQTGGLLMCALDGAWDLRMHGQGQAQQVLTDFVLHRDAARLALRQG